MILMRENFELNKEKVQTVQINHTFLAIKIGCFKLRTIQQLKMVFIMIDCEGSNNNQKKNERWNI